MAARHRTHITETGARKSIVHYHAGGRVHRSGEGHGGNRGSGRGTVTGNINNGTIFGSVISRILQIGRGISAVNRAIDISPRGAAILADLPLVSWSGAVGGFDIQSRVNSPDLSHVRGARSNACGQALTKGRRHVGPVRGNAQFVKFGPGPIIRNRKPSRPGGTCVNSAVTRR